MLNRQSVLLEARLIALLSHTGRHDLTKRFTSELRAIAERLQETENTGASSFVVAREPAHVVLLSREELIQYILDKVTLI